MRWFGHAQDTSGAIALWAGRPWAQQPVSVQLECGRPALRAGERGQGWQIAVRSVHADEPALATGQVAMTLLELAHQVPSDTVIVLDWDAAPFITFQGLRGVQRSSAHLEGAAIPVADWSHDLLLEGVSKVPSLRRLETDLTAVLGAGRLLSCQADRGGGLLLVLDAPLSRTHDLALARAVGERHHPVSPVHVIGKNNLPRRLRRRLHHLEGAG